MGMSRTQSCLIVVKPYGRFLDFALTNRKTRVSKVYVLHDQQNEKRMYF